jgi:hypothetical protein
MFASLLAAADRLALALQQAVPPRLRGVAALAPGHLAAARAGQAVRLELPEDMVLSETLDPPPGGVTPSWTLARVEAFSPWEVEACLWQLHQGADGLRLGLIPLRVVEEAGVALQTSRARLAEVVAGPFVFRKDDVQLRRWRDRVLLAASVVTLLGLGLGALGLTMAGQAGDRQALAETALARNAARLAAGAGPAQAALALLPRKASSLGLALSHLAASLPQDSYLSTLQVTAEGFEISGQTARPEAIIPALATDPAFAGVDFAGPAARDPDTGSYSFTIRGKLVTP